MLAGLRRGRDHPRLLLLYATATLRRFRGSIARRGTHWQNATKTTYQAILNIRLTAEVTACQRASSAPSCFLPAAVSSYIRARRPFDLVIQSARIQPASSMR